MRVGATADAAHAEAHQRCSAIASATSPRSEARPEAIGGAPRRSSQEARERDVYLMCMCRYRTPGRACHTYALLELARELDHGVSELAEPVPKRHAAAGQAPAAGRSRRQP